jgi:hypothetical protein
MESLEKFVNESQIQNKGRTKNMFFPVMLNPLVYDLFLILFFNLCYNGQNKF